MLNPDQLKKSQRGMGKFN